MDRRPQRVRRTMADVLRARGKLGPYYVAPEPEPAEQEEKPVKARRGKA